MSTTYSVITVWQPWATLIAEECKPFEFRGWAAPRSLHGQRVGIHSAARKVSVAEVRGLLVRLHSKNWRSTGLKREASIALLERVKADLTALPLSSIVCTAELGVPVLGEILAQRMGVDLTNDSDRIDHSMWGWPLSGIERLTPPLPARGQQGFWKWTGP